jgi:hypothetical protein
MRFVLGKSSSIFAAGMAPMLTVILELIPIVTARSPVKAAALRGGSLSPITREPKE